MHLENGNGLGELCTVQLCEEAEVPDKNPYETVVKEMIDRVDTSGDTTRELRQMLLGYKDILSTSDYDLVGAIGVLHKIDTGDAKPLKQALRRLPINHQEAIGDQVKEMLEQKFIQPSNQLGI